MAPFVHGPSHPMGMTKQCRGMRAKDPLSHLGIHGPVVPCAIHNVSLRNENESPRSRPFLSNHGQSLIATRAGMFTSCRAEIKLRTLWGSREELPSKLGRRPQIRHEIGESVAVAGAREQEAQPPPHRPGKRVVAIRAGARTPSACIAASA